MAEQFELVVVGGGLGGTVLPSAWRRMERVFVQTSTIDDPPIV
jgi:uncharacterized protein YjeT (DUF2065 family)